jgi:hypothetical protein
MRFCPISVPWWARDFDGARKLISKAYLLLVSQLLPAFGLLMTTADYLVELIYTRQYRGAVPLCGFTYWDRSQLFSGSASCFGRLGGRDDRRDTAIRRAGAVAGIVLWEWWALIKVAKAPGTSIVN